MADSVSIASVNPLGNFNVGNLSSLGSILLVVFIAVFILGCIGALIWFNVVKKQYWIKIKTFRLVGNTPTKVGEWCAKEIPFGMAGDKLWRVAPMGIVSRAFKIVKWLPVGKIQSAPSEFWYWIRKDGEWINFSLADIDEISSLASVKFVQEDMRLQRLATDRLLEQRLMQKTFWEKWKDTIMLVIFFLVTAVCMVIIFYQWSKLLDKMQPLVQSLTQSLNIIQRTCNLNATSSGLIPA